MNAGDTRNHKCVYISFLLTGKIFMVAGHMKSAHIVALNKLLKYGWSREITSSLIAKIYSHCPHLVHISIDLWCRASDDGGIPLPTQTAHRLHQEGQQWRLSGQSSCSLGSGSGDWTSTETGNPWQHIHISSQWRLYSLSLPGDAQIATMARFLYVYLYMFCKRFWTWNTIQICR